MKNPDILNIDMTYRCNQKCIMCASWKIKDKTRKELSTNEIINFIHELLKKYHLKNINFLGGEPLIKKDLEKIIATIPSNINTKIITNGTLITEDRARKLIRSKVHYVRFSIDGPEQIHDMFRGKGSYKKAVLGLSNLYNAKKEMDAKNPVIIIAPCISKANLNDMGPMFELAKKYEAKLVFTNFLIDMTNTPKDFIEGKEITFIKAVDPSNFVLSDKEKSDFLQKNVSNVNYSNSIINRLRKRLKVFITNELFKQLENNYFDCDRARRMMILDPWGDLFPCEFLYRYKYGNIKEGIDVWHSDKRKEIRRKIRAGKLNICKDCNKKNLKRGPRVVIQDFKSFSKFILGMITK